MSQHFFETPILNSPYAAPDRHWELDGGGQPTNLKVANRRRSSLVSPIPKPRRVKGKAIIYLANAGALFPFPALRNPVGVGDALSIAPRHSSPCDRVDL
jgi:hypothetical protein